MMNEYIAETLRDAVIDIVPSACDKCHAEMIDLETQLAKAQKHEEGYRFVLQRVRDEADRNLSGWSDCSVAHQDTETKLLNCLSQAVQHAENMESQLARANERIAELEPLAEIGRRVMAMPVQSTLVHYQRQHWYARLIGFHEDQTAYDAMTPRAALEVLESAQSS